MSKQVENHKLRHYIHRDVAWPGEPQWTRACFMLPFNVLLLLLLLCLLLLLLLLFRVSFIFILATLENVYEPYLSMYWFTVADTSRIRHHHYVFLPPPPLPLPLPLLPSHFPFLSLAFPLCLTNHGQYALKTHSLRVAAGKGSTLTRSAALPLDWLCIPRRARGGGGGLGKHLYTLCTWAGYFVKTSVFGKVLISSYNFTFSVFRNFDYFPTTDKLPLSLAPSPFWRLAGVLWKRQVQLKIKLTFGMANIKRGESSCWWGSTFGGELYRKGAGRAVQSAGCCEDWLLITWLPSLGLLLFSCITCQLIIRHVVRNIRNTVHWQFLLSCVCIYIVYMYV